VAGQNLYTVDDLSHRLEVFQEQGEAPNERHYRWRLWMMKDGSIIGDSEERFPTYGKALLQGMIAHGQLCDQLQPLRFDNDGNSRQ